MSRDRCVVLLRGVNVGGHNRISPTEFKGVLEALGGRDIVTYLNSGNAVLDADPKGLPKRVAAALADHLGLQVDVLVRTGAELAAVVDANPFPHKVDEPKLLHAAFLTDQPDPKLVRQLGTKHGADEFAVGDRVLYLSFAERSVDSPLNRVLPRLKVVSTARNWSTVIRLLALAQRAA